MMIELLSVLVAVLAFLAGIMSIRSDRWRRRVKEAEATANRWQERARDYASGQDVLRNMIERLPSELRRRIGTTMNAADTSQATAHKPVSLDDLFPSWWLCEVLNRRGINTTIAREDEGRDTGSVYPGLTEACKWGPVTAEGKHPMCAGCLCQCHEDDNRTEVIPIGSVKRTDPPDVKNWGRDAFTEDGTFVNPHLEDMFRIWLRAGSWSVHPAQ